jgi:hypothetical protein
LSLRALLVGVALGMLLTVAAGLAVLVWLHRQSVPRLTRERFAEARQQWNAHGPGSYVIDVELGGANEATMHVRVRNGQVEAMTYNGLSPKRHTWDHWSIDGQFETIARELENAQNPEAAHGVSDPSQIVLRAEFDAELGYPRFFERIVMDAERPTGSREIRWKVTRFERMKE